MADAQESETGSALSGAPTVSTQLRRIARLAKDHPQRAFTSLAHHIDIDWLREAYRRTRKTAAPGVDGTTASAYAANLEENLHSLLERVKSGRYRAPPVRRVHIPKGRGKTRPIGIPTLEDKILQRAVAMVLDAVYEQEFLDCSYGFRPERSAHGALEELWQRAMNMHGGWIVEVDIESFFDSVDRARLKDLLQQRVRDGVLLRLVAKWLRAGVMEEGKITYPRAGTPQGGVISPLLANVYLHEVLDTWFEHRVKPRLVGQAYLIRYADDIVMGFSREEDARRVLAALPKRLAEYGLRLHPEKTRQLRFLRPHRDARGKGGDAGTRPETFDFLGFTHMWARARSGRWAIRRRTAKDRFTRSLRAVAQWCRRCRHWSIREQHRRLSAMVRGHDAYFGITGNGPRLRDYHSQVERVWHKWLCRRSYHARIPWEHFQRRLRSIPLPSPRIMHSMVCLAANP